MPGMHIDYAPWLVVPLYLLLLADLVPFLLLAVLLLEKVIKRGETPYLKGVIRRVARVLFCAGALATPAYAYIYWVGVRPERLAYLAENPDGWFWTNLAPVDSPLGWCFFVAYCLIGPGALWYFSRAKASPPGG